MDLTCFVYPGWNPRIRPASPRRGWMDDAPEAFPYRCLPLSIANSHGWELLAGCAFEVEWNGGPAPDDVSLRCDPQSQEADRPVALFGLGTFTLHIQGLFRTPPGWNLWVGGPPNGAKDGAAPLSGVIETDWSPYSFTMNWKLTRPHHAVRFEADEPIAHVFPVERRVIESVTPRLAPIEAAPDLKAQFESWSRSRDAFQAAVRAAPPAKPADKWQKSYFRGLTPEGRCPIDDHQAKLHVRPFASAPPDAAAPARAPPPADAASARSEEAWKIAKYEWLFDTMERQRALAPEASGVFRCQGLTPEEFLENFYAPGRPVILCGALDDWPALRLWSPAYLRQKIGAARIECQGDREADPRFEMDKEPHRRTMPFDSFIDAIEAREGNDLYLTAYNSAANTQALAPLHADLGRVEACLSEEGQGMIWIGPRGVFTALHHDLTNNLLAQIVGRKQVILAAPAETPKLYNSVHVFSDAPDLTDPAIDFARFPRLREVRLLDIVLEPGEALFIPIGWWHQVRALDFTASATFTNFRWPNEGWRDHPQRP